MKGIDISYKGIIRVALPISLGSFVQFLVVLTDNYFLSGIGIAEGSPELGMNAMNGAGNSSLIYITLLMFAVGLSSGAQILVARRNGEKQFAIAGKFFANSLWICVGLGVLLFFALRWITANALDPFLESEAVLENMQRFLNIRMFGMLFYPITLMIMGFYAGIARTRLLMYTTALTAIINIVLDWVLIFGNAGAPVLGLEGAAIATVIAEGAAFFFAVIFLFADKKNKPYQLWNAVKNFTFSYTRRITKVSLPIVGQQVIALSTWTVFFFMVENLGEKSLQASHVVRSMYLLTFVSVMGIGQATKTYVSSLIAEERQSDLRICLKRLIVINLCGVLFLTHGMWLYPEFIADQFTDDPEVLMLATKSLLIVIPAMLLAAVSSVFLNAVEGSGRTPIAFFIEVIAISLYLFFTYLLTTVYQQPVYLVWMNDYLYFGIIVIMGGLYLKFGRWKNVVI